MARILVTSISHYGDSPNGNARIATDLADGYARMGHEVWYLCQDALGSGLERELVGRVTILRYRLPGWRIGVPTSLHLEPIAGILRRHLPAPPDVVHGHAPFQYAAVRAVYGARGRWCYTVHSPLVEEMRIAWGGRQWTGRLKAALGLGWLERLESRILRWSDVVVVLSEFTRALLSRRYGQEVGDRARRIDGWTDSGAFHPLDEPLQEARRRLGWPSKTPVFFVLRRLERRMGVDRLLAACTIVRRAGHDFHVVIGGTGSEGRNLRDECRRLGLGDVVSFVGRVPQEMLATAYGACDASIVPTAELECFGIIALESIACGRPALVTPVGALPEVVSQFEREWIARDASPAGIGELLCRFLEGDLPDVDPERVAERLRHFSLARGLSEYSAALDLGQGLSETGCASV